MQSDSQRHINDRPNLSPRSEGTYKARYVTCGKKDCACSIDPSKKHGPYYNQYVGKTKPKSTAGGVAKLLAAKLLADLDASAKAKLKQYGSENYQECYEEAYGETCWVGILDLIKDWELSLRRLDGDSSATDVLGHLHEALKTADTVAWRDINAEGME